ncbi:Transcription factor IWS1 [Cucumispora dikerogammari]|nr:Transcription factor IWS1 [Cucumispora dikerogammari]
MEKKKTVNNDTTFTKTAVFTIQLLTRIYEKDLQSNKNNEPAILKSTLIDKFSSLLSKRHLCAFFINNSILDLLRKWIEPLPDNSLPNNVLVVKVLKLIKFFSNFNRNSTFYETNKDKTDPILIQNETISVFKEVKVVLGLENISGYNMEEDNLYDQIQIKADNYPSQEVRVNVDVLEKSKIGHIVRFYKENGQGEVRGVANEIFQLLLEIITST